MWSTTNHRQGIKAKVRTKGASVLRLSARARSRARTENISPQSANRAHVLPMGEVDACACGVAAAAAAAAERSRGARCRLCNTFPTPHAHGAGIDAPRPSSIGGGILLRRPFSRARPIGTSLHPVDARAAPPRSLGAFGSPPRRRPPGAVWAAGEPYGRRPHLHPPPDRPQAVTCVCARALNPRRRRRSRQRGRRRRHRRHRRHRRRLCTPPSVTVPSAAAPS